MNITKFSHSCVRIEHDGAVLVIDPGSFSEKASLDGVDAILITHEHSDHLDVDKVGDALARYPGARVYTNASAAALLAGLGDAVRPVAAGESFEAAGMRVRAYGGVHALIHADIPPVPNLGFLIEGGVYHPGDSFVVPRDAEIHTLFVPVTAPWLKVSESIDFVRAIQPSHAYALHDCLGNDVALSVIDRLLRTFSGAQYDRLAPGETITAPSR